VATLDFQQASALTHAMMSWGDSHQLRVWHGEPPNVYGQKSPMVDASPAGGTGWGQSEDGFFIEFDGARFFVLENWFESAMSVNLAEQEHVTVQIVLTSGIRYELTVRRRSDPNGALGLPPDQ
jgi:hypothetical protein